MIKNLTYANEIECVSLYGTVTIGAHSVITSQDCLGFNVALVAPGIYTCTLSRPFPRLLFASAVPCLGTETEVVTQIFSVDMSNANRTVTFGFTTSGLAQALADGTTLYIQLVLKDSTV